jgi:hypothetical protein
MAVGFADTGHVQEETQLPRMFLLVPEEMAIEEYVSPCEPSCEPPSMEDSSRWRSRALPGGDRARVGMETLPGVPYQNDMDLLF